MPQGLRNGTPRAVVHSMQMEKGLYSLRRVKKHETKTKKTSTPNVYVYIIIPLGFRSSPHTVEM